MRAKFIRGFVDGLLSTLGIVIGASAASDVIVIAAAVGGALANGISNILSALSAERVDRYHELRKIEQAMVVKELARSELDRRISSETNLTSAMDGLGTVIGGAVPILPYLFISSYAALLTSIASAIVLTALVGVYLGRLSKGNILLSAVKMALSAAGVAGAVYLIQSIIVPG